MSIAACEPKRLDFTNNFLRQDHKVYKLPCFSVGGGMLSDGDWVRVYIFDPMQISIESHFPIVFEGHIGKRIFLNTMVDPKNIYGYFVFDSVKQQWILIKNGYACFPEVEINTPKDIYERIANSRSE